MKKVNNKILSKDENEVDEITRQFFDLFTNTNNKTPNLRKIEEIFLPGGLLMRKFRSNNAKNLTLLLLILAFI